LKKSDYLSKDVDDIIGNLCEAEEAKNYKLAKLLYCVLKIRDSEVESDFWREVFSSEDAPAEMLDFAASIRQPLSICDLYLVQDLTLLKAIVMKYKLDKS